MPETLEIRLGGQFSGRSITAQDLDFSEIDPLFEHLEKATILESGVDEYSVPRGRRTKNRIPQLKTVYLALITVLDFEQISSFGVAYRFKVGRDISQAVSKITAGLAGLANNQIIPEAAAQVRKGLNRTIGRGLSVQLVNGVTTPVFTASHPPPDLDVYPTRKFESEIAARVFRVGGKTPTARVKLLGSGQDVTLQLSGEKAARELGNHLYRDAILKGQGEWVIDPKRFSVPTRLLKFKVQGSRLLKPVDVDDVIEEMTKATGGVWDNIDPTDPKQVEDMPEESGDLS
ncbi:MAG TPA: hypothetical protein VG122_26355 [Gemmata sp.]|jgi:hypothetical protein|nr:hypothetical protein [Gemmata sp.]